MDQQLKLLFERPAGHSSASSSCPFGTMAPTSGPFQAMGSDGSFGSVLVLLCFRRTSAFNTLSHHYYEDYREMRLFWTRQEQEKGWKGKGPAGPVLFNVHEGFSACMFLLPLKPDMSRHWKLGGRMLQLQGRVRQLLAYLEPGHFRGC